MERKVRSLVEEQRKTDFPCSSMVKTGIFVLVEEKCNDISILTHTYNKYGDILKSEHPLTGEVCMRYIYDENNRLIREEDASGVQRKLTYDIHGNLIRDERKPSCSIEFRYNSNNIRMDERHYLGSNLVLRTKYDEYENVIEMQEYYYSNVPTKDEELIVKSKWQKYCYNYDRGGRIEAEKHSDGTDLIYNYNSDGNLLKVYDKNSLYSVEYFYDSDGKVSRICNIRADDGFNLITRYMYNEKGNLVRKEDNVGNLVIFEYYPDDTIKEQLFRSINNGYKYLFDPNGNLIKYINKNRYYEYIYKFIELDSNHVK